MDLWQEYDDSLMPHARKLLQYDKDLLRLLLYDSFHHSEHCPMTYPGHQDQTIVNRHPPKNPE